MSIEHIAINVPEPAKMAQWYADNLDMRVVVSNAEAPFIHFVADKNGTMLEFYNNDAAPIPDYADMSPLVLHLAFAVDDVAATIEKLVLAGGTALGEVNTNAAGDQLAFVRDPWHVTVQLVKRATPLV